jgi:hypothetical protein
VPTGTRLRLRVKAGARRSEILGVHAGALKLAVNAAPERGKANRAVLALLAEALGVPPTRLQLLSGETSPDKVLQVDLAVDAVRQRLQSAIAARAARG